MNISPKWYYHKYKFSRFFVMQIVSYLQVKFVGKEIAPHFVLAPSSSILQPPSKPCRQACIYHPVCKQKPLANFTCPSF